ncbi:MAG: hypothetical protein COA43_11260 [Robiginitomaculum sp.]|nr:MAG: hypothetical protein COA43_11260 [Robiginitomaculum sp.]
MYILVDRIVSDGDVTISRVYIEGKLVCHGLEQEYHEIKVVGETRIPAGIYEMGVRKVGGFHKRYLHKFGKPFHRGMLHVLNVPNFKYILWHVGNYGRDTQGCLLLGRADYNAMAVWQSKRTYMRVYNMVIEAALKGRVTVEYRDSDR